MIKLVVVSKNPAFEIGKIYRGLERGPWNRPEPNQCFRGIGKSTEEAWIDCLVSFMGKMKEIG